MLYRAENISVFVEGCNFKIKCPKKLRPAGDYCHLKVSTLKVNSGINTCKYLHSAWVVDDASFQNQ